MIHGGGYMADLHGKQIVIDSKDYTKHIAMQSAINVCTTIADMIRVKRQLHVFKPDDVLQLVAHMGYEMIKEDGKIVAGWFNAIGTTPEDVSKKYDINFIIDASLEITKKEEEKDERLDDTTGGQQPERQEEDELSKARERNLSTKNTGQQTV